ncbi:type III pyridoxal 5-phosphate (PLP)-dependent enzyme, YggS family [Malaciobacter marinus]|uniref:Pyridoxal phosphate homeostasis protein n=1 Tax=Malaciobacter marinus TaxID=505249 RepID=A0A347TLR1_9BACT|nr:YggS family pyridoxal phosphate-dependent enzyme [Malaciobacter marinus]AXX87539.1 type III pyridoxal 5-phosphate (PLP)-dependent enzyme, YggS family [Malaciobacter marinus]PHO14493.1 YggS family pyridoxal phosphate-dependent enzyme [Malaciobacter marinus]
MQIQKAIDNLDKLIADVEDARLQLSEHHIVKIVGISKYNSSEDVSSLYKAGQRAFGENKVQDLKQKMIDLEDFPLEWHFVGRLQKNKINNLIDLKPTLMQSLDSIELAEELNKKLEAKDKKMNCLLQINSAKEDSKAGVMPEDAIEIYKQIIQTCSNITLKGVMSIGAHVQDEEIIEKSFNTTKIIFDELKPLGAKYCSMGMSNDFKLAIKCGSNMIRVGSSLFK